MKIWLLFWIVEFHKVVYQHIAGEVKIVVCVSREFPYKSPDERILEIGPHLPKLLSNTQGYTFWGHSVDRRKISDEFACQDHGLIC